MIKNLDKYLVPPNLLVKKAIASIVLNNERLVFVANKNKKLLGTLSEGDVLKLLLKNKTLDMKISDVMNKSFIFLSEKEKMKAKKIFKEKGVSVIPIVKSNMVISYVCRITDFID